MDEPVTVKIFIRYQIYPDTCGRGLRSMGPEWGHSGMVIMKQSRVAWNLKVNQELKEFELLGCRFLERLTNKLLHFNQQNEQKTNQFSDFARYKDKIHGELLVIDYA